MKLKALLLGSAAAMIAVTGANAADAVVAEPEPVEYVRVCDMYGNGYFYIPGTETCMRISGLVRSTYSYDSANVAAANNFSVNAATGAIVNNPTAARGSTGSWGYRGRLNIQTANESDYGPITSYLRLQGDGNGGSDANVGIDRATIGIGGLRIGYTDQYWTTNVGYGAPGAIADASQYDQALVMDYTYSANGFSATIGMQDELGTTAGAENPDFYAGFNYSSDMYTVAATFGYDSIAKASAGNAMLQLNVIDGLTLKGIYNHNFNRGTANHFIATNYQWVVGVNYQATDEINVYANYSDTNVANAAVTTVGMNYAFAPGVRVQAEGSFRENNTSVYRVRVQRTF